jgi:hypothetical protein
MFVIAVQGFAGAKLKRSCMKSVLGWSIFLQSQRSILESVVIYISFVCNVFTLCVRCRRPVSVNMLRKEGC